MGDGHYAVSVDESGFHDIHVLAANGIVQPEALSVVRGNLQGAQFRHGPPTLVRNVVYHEDAARKGHLVVVAVMRLRQGQHTF